MKRAISFTEEDQTLIDFTKELIRQYSDSLDDELRHMKYKVNLNDSYERLVYYDNGKDSQKYIQVVLNNMDNQIKEDVRKNNIEDINQYTIEYITNVLKRVNIQSEIINDFVDYLYRQRNAEQGKYRRRYDLNIGDNRDLHFTKDYLKIYYVTLSKPISTHLRKIDDFYMLLNDLKVIGKELDVEYREEEEYSVRTKRHK